MRACIATPAVPFRAYDYASAARAACCSVTSFKASLSDPLPKQ